jgi:hypothetical protein
MEWRALESIGAHGGGGGYRSADPLPQSEIKKKLRHDLSKILLDLHFSLNQPPTSAEDWCSGILKNVTKT